MEYKVTIPEEAFDLLDFKKNDLPGVAVINSSLKTFEAKEVFAWHCSIIIDLENLAENGMPSQEEMVIIDKFGDYLDLMIKTLSERPNALFLARITWNGTKEFIYRVYDADITDRFLRKVIEEKLHPREFDFRIDLDKDWEIAKWHLTDWE